MNTKRRILLASLLVAILGGLMVVVTHRQEPEPVYQGKPLSAWLELLNPYFLTTNLNTQRAEEARAAIRQIGTNAIPPLLRRLRATDPPFIPKLATLAQKQHVIRIHYAPPSSHYDEALTAIEYLGPEAESVLPELLRIYDQNPSLVVQERLPYVFAFIGLDGKAAIPSMVRKAAHPTFLVRHFTIAALGQFHAESDLVVPVLVKALQDPYLEIRLDALHALGAFGAKAISAVPALLALDKDPYRNVLRRSYSVSAVHQSVYEALERIDHEAAAQLLRELHPP